MESITSQSCSNNFNEAEYMDPIESTIECEKKVINVVQKDIMLNNEEANHHLHMTSENNNKESLLLRQQLEAHLTASIMQQDSLISDTNDYTKQQFYVQNPQTVLKTELKDGISQKLNLIGILVNRQIRRLAMFEAKSTIIQEQLISSQDQIRIAENKLSQIINSDTKTKQLALLDKVSKQILEKFLEIEKESMQLRDKFSIEINNSSKKIREEVDVKLLQTKEGILLAEKIFTETLNQLKSYQTLTNDKVLKVENQLKKYEDQLTAVDLSIKQSDEKLSKMERQSTQFHDQLLIQIENGSKTIQKEMNAKLTQIKEEMLLAIAKLRNDTDVRFNNVLTIQKSTINNLSQTQDQLIHIKDNSKKIQDQLGDLDQISKQNKNQLSSAAATLIETNKRMTLMKNELVTLSTDRSGAFIWKISGWTENMKDAKSGKTKVLYSPEFHSSQYGYKMKMQLDPNGQQTEEGTHMSLFMRLIPGEFDSILSWPFRLNYTFSLLDQTIDKLNAKHIIMTITPTSDSKQVECWKRPDKTANAGWGYDKFVTHEQLNNGKFIMDDIIFIKFESNNET